MYLIKIIYIQFLQVKLTHTFLQRAVINNFLTFNFGFTDWNWNKEHNFIWLIIIMSKGLWYKILWNSLITI